MPFINDVLDHNRAALAVPEPLRPSRFLFEPDAVMALLRQRIVGQPQALAAVEAVLQVVKAEIGDPGRPLGVLLFLGPTGVGKTELARLVAQAIHGSADALCRIDMNTLAQEHYAAALTGAPPGYVGSKEGTTLFDADKIAGSFSRPGVVLFDELEKASREVIRALLNVLDSGRLTLAAGSRTLDFRNSLIFLTSNAGAQAVWQRRQRFASGWRRWLRLQPGGEAAQMEAALQRQFEPEFLNRIDRIVTFDRIGSDALAALLAIELDKLAQRLARQQRELCVSASARTLLCRDHDVRFGARDLARRLRARLEPALAQAILSRPEARQLVVDVRDGTLVVEAT